MDTTTNLEGVSTVNEWTSSIDGCEVERGEDEGFVFIDEKTEVSFRLCKDGYSEKFRLRRDRSI